MLETLRKFINKVGKRMTDMTAETVLAVDEKTWLEQRLTAWIDSKERRERMDAERYYLGDHDILHRERMAIGESGRLEPVENAINNKIVDNIYRHMVDQKRNFSFGKPFTVECENEQALKAVQSVMGFGFERVINALSLKALNCGYSALYPFYDEEGNFSFEVFSGSELMPFWKDSLHTKLQFAVRYYVVEKQKTFSKEKVEKVQIFAPEAVFNFIRSGGKLIPDTEAGETSYYMTADRVIDPEANKTERVAYGWERVPLIFFRSGEDEQPLLNRCRALQDAYNEILSNFKNQMDEEPSNSILVLHNYDGEDLAKFRSKLAMFRAIKVRSIEGVEGKVETLNIEVNAANYELILKLLKKAIVERCRGFDVKDDTVGGNANRMHISAMYNDCEIDAREIETDFNAGLHDTLFFILSHIANVGGGDFTGEEFTFTFDHDMIQDWQGDIATLVQASSVYPREWIYKQTPGVDDPAELLEMEEAQKKKEMEEFALPQPTNIEGSGVDPVGE